MAGEHDEMAVVIAPATMDEAARWANALIAAGFHPSVDTGSPHVRQTSYPILVPPSEGVEARAFLKGLRSSQARAPGLTLTGGGELEPAAIPQALVAARPAAAAWRWDQLLPLAGRALALLTGLLVIAGGLAMLASMLHFLSSLRDH
jgi:hypothetical protein